jgi:hypothetical protein
MTRILIENYDLDVDKRLSNQITYSVNDLKNIDTKTTSFTKTIILPGTANNNALLGNIFEFNNANFTNDDTANIGYNFNASKTAKCSILIEGMVVIKGVFKLLEIVIDGKNVEYECSIVGELGGFSMKLAGNTLEQLDFSAYNHTYSIANITASWNNDNAGAGYYYPLIDYGNYSTAALFSTNAKKYWQFKTFRPALFVKEYLDKIFAAAGYTYDCALFSTDRFKRLIIPHNQKLLTTLSTLQLKLNGKVATYTGASNWKWDVITAGSFTGDINGEVWTYNGAAPITVNINVSLSGQVISQTIAGTFAFELIKNSTVIGSVSVTTPIVPPSFTFSAKKINATSITLTTGNSIYVRYPVGQITSLRQISSSLQIDSIYPNLVPINLSDNVTINDSIPKNILQKDFFASILKLFNLYVDENRFSEKHLIIKPYVDYYDGSVEDWSDKIDKGKQIRIKPMSEMNSRYYLFQYKDDADYYNDLYKKRYNISYGSRKFDSLYEFSKDTETVDLVFSPTPLVGYAGEQKIYSTILKQTNDLEEQIDSNIRILIAQKVPSVTSYNIYNGASLLTSQTAYGYAGHFNNPDAVANDLNFGATEQLFFTLVSGALNVNQFNVYYSPYMAEITDKDSRLLTCNVKLTDVDIFNLNFAKFKYIDGGLYRLIKLIDYTPEANETTKAEFLRVINKEY